MLLPLYKGLESQFEDYLYQYFRELGKKYNFKFSVKKTNLDIDKYINSQTGGKGRGKADGYIFKYNLDNQLDNLLVLLELESTGNLDKGIEQNNIYINGIRENWKKLFNNDSTFLNFVFDGRKIFLSEISLNNENIIFDKIEINESNHKIISEKLLKLLNDYSSHFSKTLHKNEDINFIKIFKERIRKEPNFKKYRAEIMTFLGALYSISSEKLFIDAISYLERRNSVSHSIENKIFSSYQTIKTQLSLKDNIEASKKLQDLYIDIAIPMYLKAEQEGIDLYGFFYEQLMEKGNKQEGGEYYTPRHIIRPIIKMILGGELGNINNIGANKKGLNKLKIYDPFCGSGGFLYEYTNYIKKTHDLDDDEIDDIVSNSVYGTDKEDISSAQLNMYLIGDGSVNLETIYSSIGWRHSYKNTKNKEEKEKILMAIEFLLKLYLNEEQISFLKNKNYIKEKEGKIILTKKFIEEFDNENINGLDDFLNILFNKNEKFKNYGNIDYLFTNVPYGPIDKTFAKIIKDEKISSRLESNSLKDCIDFLKHGESNSQGRKTKDGGIGIIVIPSGILETKENLYIRKYMTEHCHIHGIISLPKYTFAPYTVQKTYILILEKKSINEINNWTDNEGDFFQKSEIFMYISDRDGKANSTKRYTIDTKENIKYKDFELNEYIHNDFVENFGDYKGKKWSNYSKIEKCFNIDTSDNYPDYNQKRIIDNWDGNDWEVLEGKKWGRFNISFDKQTETKEIKVSKKLNTLLIKSKINLNNCDIEKLDISSKDKKLLNDYTLYFDEESNYYKYLKETFFTDIDLLPEHKLINKVKKGEISDYKKGDIKISNIIYNDSELLYKNKYILDIFDIKLGTQISELEAYQNPGNIPVFTSGISGATYYIKDGLEGKVISNGPALIWNRKGNAGNLLSFYKKEKFYLTNDSGYIKVRKQYIDNIDLKFIKIYLGDILKRHTQSNENNGQLNKTVLQSIVINIPNLKIQKELLKISKL